MAVLLTILQNNADEGSLIPRSNIITQNDLIAWLKENFPNLSTTQINSILAAYPSGSGPVSVADARYATSGFGPATAVNVSQVATGQQQRAFVCFAKQALLICD